MILGISLWTIYISAECFLNYSQRPHRYGSDILVCFYCLVRRDPRAEDQIPARPCFQQTLCWEKFLDHHNSIRNHTSRWYITYSPLYSIQSCCYVRGFVVKGCLFLPLKVWQAFCMFFCTSLKKISARGIKNGRMEETVGKTFLHLTAYLLTCKSFWK